jgi:CspA family cold shock protein
VVEAFWAPVRNIESASQMTAQVPSRAERSPAHRPSSQRAGAGPTKECLGSVKWFNVEKGFGFVAQDRGGKDVFVHVTTLDRSGLSELPEGRRVRMQISQGQKGPEARSIELLDERI